MRLCTLAAILSSGLITSCTKNELRYQSASMEPSIRRGELITIEPAAYRGSKPARWDVVLFEAPTGSGGSWASRIAGLPGETVNFRDGSLLIDGEIVDRPSHVAIAGYHAPEGDLSPAAPGPVSFPFKIPAGSYFVLGDNVDNALDSRYWGGLDEAKILGKVAGK